jgi:aminocarboxymuconate-semialdehyde decarboxylase
MIEQAPKIDIHAHFYPREFLDLVAAEGAPFQAGCRDEGRGPVIHAGALRTGPLAPKFIDVDLRIEAMDAQDVDAQALSLTQPMVYWAEPKLSRRLSAAFNDACVGAHQKYPRRLYGLAMIPAQDSGEALREIERVRDAPGIRGIYMGSYVRDMDLSDERLFPIYERLSDLRLPLFLHPLKVIGSEDRLRPYFLFNLLGNPFDTATAAAHLIFSGVLDRFPGLDVVLPHAGGAFPFLAGRLNHGWKVRPECRHLESGPESYLRRFHYDTISHSHAALDYLIDNVGADRVMLGSDFCFDMGYDQPVQVVHEHAGLDQAARNAILGGNAHRLLGIADQRRGEAARADAP